MSLSKEVASLVYLLDDTDNEVVSEVEKRLLSLGKDIIPDLEDYLYAAESALLIERLQDIIKKLKFDDILVYFTNWVAQGGTDLLGALVEIAKVKYPEITRQNIENEIDKIKLDAWLELHYDLTSYEKVRILNHIFYNVHKFTGDTEDYHHEDNSFINRVLNRKKGNPVSLGVIYAIVAQKLNIPVFGVNLPQHFILGYKSDGDFELIKAYNEESQFDGNEGGDVLFYINTFSQGLVLSKQSITEFLKQLNIEPRPEFYQLCSNTDIIQRIIRNLLFAYEKTENHTYVDVLLQIMSIISEKESE